MINEYLMQMSPDVGGSLYNMLGFLQYPAFIGMLLLASVKYRMPTKHKIVIWMAFAIALFWGSSLVPVLSRLTAGIIPGINMGVGFAFVMLILAALVYFLNVPVFSNFQS